MLRALPTTVLSKLLAPLSVSRTFCSAATPTEKNIEEKLRSGLKALHIKVKDTSGGCGAMYSIEVVADDFRGVSIVKQHQMVTKLLQEDIKSWHGFQLVTKATPS